MINRKVGVKNCAGRKNKSAPIRTSPSLTVLPVVAYVLAVLPPPHHVGLRVSRRLAGQADVHGLQDDHVRAGLAIHYARWNWKQGFPFRSARGGGSLGSFTHYLQVPLPAAHRVRVHLAHVPPSVRLLNVPDVQVPGPVVVVAEGYPRVLGYDMVVN